MKISVADHTDFVKRSSDELGFDFCGISKATQLDEDAKRLENWLRQGMHGDMHYMENHFDLRVNPQRLVPGAKSVITLLLNYFPGQSQPSVSPKISKYAYGEDYHVVIRAKLNMFLQLLRQRLGDFNGRGFVDSAPVLERAWAQKSGLGWVGKNGNLINKKAGSFFFIATLIIDLELQADDAYVKDYCGSCTKCIDACPTAAILPDKVVNGSKCISYFTIELKDALIPDAMIGKLDNWLFGCDVCQDVCPWNRFSNTNTTEAFKPVQEILSYTENDWEELTEEKFKIVFKNSAIKRTKFAGIKRNLQFIKTHE